jgi:ribosome-associated protein
MSNLIINESIRIPYAEFQLRAVRSQGPGGQNVNKVNSKVVLQWNVSESPSLPPAVRHRFLRLAQSYLSQTGVLTIASQRTRHRHRNQEDCFEKLRAMLLDAARRPTPRKPTKPTRASKLRRLRAKDLTAQKKQNRRGPNLEG